ncbi:MAG: lipid-A-disaccharide synthase [Prevotella sp.]
MKYYLIVGEASGDLHASRLMEELKRQDVDADFRFVGGDKMAAVGGHRVRHFSEMAYMGFVPVLLHAGVILRCLRECKEDIARWQPDVVILVDYPGFNLKIARYVRQSLGIPVHYYISPKVWAWKEYRVKNIKRDVDELFSILPFEVQFFEQKHGYKIHYVGNPTMDEVDEYLVTHPKTSDDSGSRKVIALLAGSRRQEIKDNLPAMIEAAEEFAADYDIVVAGAPAIPAAYYDRFIAGKKVRVVYNQTYALLASATLAVVTSGTATLETALFGVPQVVCYETPLPRLIALLRRLLIHVPYISLVNLIAGEELVSELVADRFSVENIRNEMRRLLPGSPAREPMLRGYGEVRRRLGTEKAPDNAARIIISLLSSPQKPKN